MRVCLPPFLGFFLFRFWFWSWFDFSDVCFCYQRFFFFTPSGGVFFFGFGLAGLREITGRKEMIWPSHGVCDMGG